MSSPRVRTGPLILVSLLSSIGFSGVALAQVAGSGGSITGVAGIRVAVTTVDGESRDQKGPVYLNLDECDADVPVEFRLDGAPMNKPVIDVYRGENCNSARRTDAAENVCAFVASVPGKVASDLRVVISAQALILGECADHQEGAPKFWFLPVSETQSAEAVTTYGLNQQIITDTLAPGAPIEVEGGGGENVITITWKSNAYDTDLQRFIVYIDPAPEGAISEDTTQAVQDAIDGGTVAGGNAGAINPDCPSRHLIPGQTPVDLPSEIVVDELNNENQRSYQLHPSELGLQNTVVAVAVMAEDKAGNRSPLSEVVCANVIQTTDFWESYQQNGGKAVEGCPCSASGATQLASGWPVAITLLLMGVSARRRRRGGLETGRAA